MKNKEKKQFIKEFSQFIHQIMKLNIENGVNIHTPLFVEMLVQNIESSEFGEIAFNNQSLQLEMSIKTRGIITYYRNK